MWIYLLAGIILAAIAWRDATTHMIPDYMIALLLACGLVRSLWEHDWRRGVTGFVVCGLPIFLLSVIFPRGIGGGDSKLCAALGALLGPLDGYLVIWLALAGLCLWGVCGRRTHKPIPYAPFVLPAYVAVIFLRWKGLI